VTAVGNVTVGSEAEILFTGKVFSGSSTILPVKSYGALIGGVIERVSVLALAKGIQSSSWV
jgi:hypothetical protein